jgi:hypothetical protein
MPLMVMPLLFRNVLRRLGFRAVGRRAGVADATRLKTAELSKTTGSTARTRRAAWHIAVLVAALGFVLRALVPLGFMPDARALQGGHIELTLCSPGSAGGGRTVSLSLSSANMNAPSVTLPRARLRADTSADATTDFASLAGNSADSHPDGSLAGTADCPFGLMAAQASIVPPAVGITAAAVVEITTLRLLAPRLASVETRGPPLGSRAPPAAA